MENADHIDTPTAILLAQTVNAFDTAKLLDTNAGDGGGGEEGVAHLAKTLNLPALVITWALYGELNDMSCSPSLKAVAELTQWPGYPKQAAAIIRARDHSLKKLRRPRTAAERVTICRLVGELTALDWVDHEHDDYETHLRGVARVLGVPYFDLVLVTKSHITNYEVYLADLREFAAAGEPEGIEALVRHVAAPTQDEHEPSTAQAA